jgi:tRNA(Ser,Leu) C12 N-acetylase TAN1
MEFKPYQFQKDIPAKLRRVILEETCVTQVKKLSLATCNEILARHHEEAQEDETLKSFEIEFHKNGKHGIRIAEGRQKALIEIDRILEFGENKDPDIVIAVRQAKRLINGYIKGEWFCANSIDSIYQY